MAWPSSVITTAGERSLSAHLPPTSHPARRVLTAQSLPVPSSLSFRSSRSRLIAAHVRVYRPIAACSSLGFPEETGDSPENSTPNASSSSPFTEGAATVRLPRRNLLVQFTCNSCGERTERIINRVAYDRGTVFLQCAGCGVYHKLVDNLNLVVEYDLRDERDPSVDAG